MKTPTKKQIVEILKNLSTETLENLAAETSVEAPSESHQQVALTTPDGVVVDVDARLARLLPMLWARGIGTRFSCQGDAGSGLAYILFDDGQSADRFAAVAWRRNWKWESCMPSRKSGLHHVVRFPTGDIKFVEQAFEAASINSLVEAAHQDNDPERFKQIMQDIGLDVAA